MWHKIYVQNVSQSINVKQLKKTITFTVLKSPVNKQKPFIHMECIIKQ